MEENELEKERRLILFKMSQCTEPTEYDELVIQLKDLTEKIRQLTITNNVL